MKSTIALLASSFALVGCATNGGMGDVSTLSAQPTRAVGSLADIVNNIKCDMITFMQDNELVTERGSTIGGTLKFTVDRSVVQGGGLTLGIPIFTGVKLGASAKADRTTSFGEVITTPFVMTFEKGRTSVDCTKRDTILVKNTMGAVGTATLSSPLLELGALRGELDRIQTGQPKIMFVDFNFDGSVILKRSSDSSLNIDVVWIKPEVSNKFSSDYKIEYKIGTNWQKILKDAGYEVKDATETSGVTHYKNFGQEDGAIVAAVKKQIDPATGTLMLIDPNVKFDPNLFLPNNESSLPATGVPKMQEKK